ncbi:MAG: HAD family hydrolase [Opitutaceae bacterium]|nr:HAD family hydrolase [Opitutaceae bacterium]
MPDSFSPRAVVFDLDGTLLDSLTLVLEAIAHAIEPFGARPTAEIFAQLGGPPERFLAALVPHERHIGPAVRRMEAFHREHGHLIQPFPGAEPLLAELHAAGIALGIWTGRDRESTAYLLREHRLDHFFRDVVCGDDLPTHKPDPAGLQELLRRMGTSATDTLFVGDADVDVMGGVSAGVRTLLIRHSRRIDAGIMEQAWRTAAASSEAFSAVRTCVGARIRNLPSRGTATPGGAANSL